MLRRKKILLILSAYTAYRIGFYAISLLTNPVLEFQKGLHQGSLIQKISIF
jgi:hypothetical protein